ncbi:uncharacterized protein mrvi1 isoform X3 [Phyllopteryx taeniolatus]|uniref:uncharacterized protein mrvi1 isoform X3 n=1 Tax=Phyllopteryx taeniolatus TaxID=161469 RepID=UPI002AD5910C|nr:uncharacterized protein mrvi1 isoform X3 [Phyllopteryx taeniolatus]
MWEPPDDGPEDSSDVKEFSERELLDIMYDACDSSGAGEASASSISEYLRKLSSRSRERGRLTSLQRLLDPDCRDPVVSREMFHSAVTQWIARCGQDRADADRDGDASYADTSGGPFDAGALSGLEFSTTLTNAAPADSPKCACACDGNDLSETVSELKRAHRKLREQNGGLLRTVDKCEDVNLRLTLEIAELRAKLARSNVSATETQSAIGAVDDFLVRFVSDRLARPPHSSEDPARIPGRPRPCGVCMFSLSCLRGSAFLPRPKNMHALETRNCPVGVTVSANGCLFVCMCPAIGWRPVQGAPRLLPDDGRDGRMHGFVMQMDVLLSFGMSSSQRSAVRVRSITEELEETRRAFTEAQERAGRTQASCTKLSNEVECLKVHIRRLEDKNEKVSFEKTCSEENVSKLRKANGDLRKELLMDKMKNAHVENHSILEVCFAAAIGSDAWIPFISRGGVSQGVQAELTRLHQHSRQVLLRYDRLRIGPETPHARDPPNFRSLQSEMQDLQQADERSPPALRTDRENIQSIIRRIKSTEIAHLWRDRLPERGPSPVEPQEKPFPQRQQRQASIKRQLVNVLQDLELQESAREEKGERPDERRKAREEEPKPNRIGTQIPQCKKVAIVKWWKALSADGAKARTGESRTFRELAERARLRRAERTVGDTREPVCRLQTSHECQQKGAPEQKSGGVVLVHKETNTDGAGGRRVEQQRDAEPGAASRHKPVQLGVTADRMLAALRRTQATVNSALRSAQLVKESEERVSRVGLRMESVARTLEAALGRAGRADVQLGLLEARIVGKPNQTFPRPSCPEHSSEDKDQTESPPPPPPAPPAPPPPPPHVIPEVSESPQLPMNGDAERGSSGKSSADSTAEGNFVFPLTRSRPCLLPAMPTLPEEEEDSPEDPDSSSSSPSTCAPAESGAAATIIYPQQTDVVRRDGRPREQARPRSPRARPARNSSAGSITTVDSAGHVIDLVKDKLPEMRISEEDRQKNLQLLEEAKKVSDRFLMRRGRRSTSSFSDSPAVVEVPEVTCSPHSISQHLDAASARVQKDAEGGRLAGDWKTTEKRKVSSGTLTPRFAIPKENCDPKSPPGANKSEDGGRNSGQAPATGVAKPVPRPPTQQAPCTAEIKTIGAFPPLMRAVSWDAVRGINSRNGTDETSSDKGALKAAGLKELKELPAPKLSKFREEHKLMRNQSVVGSKLPDLSEAAEQEKGPACASSEESKPDAMPNISDVMLRKLKLHRGLPGCAPPLTEKEVENAFVQLSLAFRNDNYTLDTRLKQAERERNLTEEDTQKELEEFKGALKMSAPQWQNLEQREAYQRLIETLAVLHRLAARLSSRSEIVGAVRQEKRMSKATEVMMQYVENLKRTYEKDHAELTEFKKLANQNSNRCYGSSVETGDDGVSRASRSMSLTLGKALPRRRVSVAVVPKFNLLNIPGQTPPAAAPNAPSASAPGAALPALSEASDVKGNSSPESTQQATTERGKSVPEQEGQSAKPAVDLEEIRAEIRAELKAKIEEEAYNKGYQEGLKQNKAIREEKREEEEEAADKLPQSKIRDEESGKKIKTSRRMEELLVLLSRICPKVLWRKQLLWVALVVFLVMCLVISVFTFFTGYYNKRDDT